jgi:hypothetical protein
VARCGPPAKENPDNEWATCHGMSVVDELVKLVVLVDTVIPCGGRGILEYDVVSEGLVDPLIAIKLR